METSHESGGSCLDQELSYSDALIGINWEGLDGTLVHQKLQGHHGLSSFVEAQDVDFTSEVSSEDHGLCGQVVKFESADICLDQVSESSQLEDSLPSPTDLGTLFPSSVTRQMGSPASYPLVVTLPTPVPYLNGHTQLTLGSGGPSTIYLVSGLGQIPPMDGSVSGLTLVGTEGRKCRSNRREYKADRPRQIAMKLPVLDQSAAKLGPDFSLSELPGNLLPNVSGGFLLGESFEVLGRCTECVRLSRTISYCRQDKRHSAEKAMPCVECETVGRSMADCRRKLSHRDINCYISFPVINMTCYNTEEVQSLCVQHELPLCFCSLQSLSLRFAEVVFSKKKFEKEISAGDSGPALEGGFPRKAVHYAKGYLYPYSQAAWEAWLNRFSRETGTLFRIRTGKRVNKKDDHGLALHNGFIVSYRVLESQLYNCSLGGRPRRCRSNSRRPARQGRSSNLIGCPAVIQTRLLETSDGWRALEVTVPKLAAHKPAHTPVMLTGLSTQVLSSGVKQEGFNNETIPGDNPVPSEEPSGHSPYSAAPATPSSPSSAISQHGSRVEILKGEMKSMLGECVSLVDQVSSETDLRSISSGISQLFGQLSQLMGGDPLQETLLQDNNGSKLYSVSLCNNSL